MNTNTANAPYRLAFEMRKKALLEERAKKEVAAKEKPEQKENEKQ